MNIFYISVCVFHFFGPALKRGIYTHLCCVEFNSLVYTDLFLFNCETSNFCLCWSRSNLFPWNQPSSFSH